MGGYGYRGIFSWAGLKISSSLEENLHRALLCCADASYQPLPSMYLGAPGLTHTADGMAFLMDRQELWRNMGRLLSHFSQRQASPCSLFSTPSIQAASAFLRFQPGYAISPSLLAPHTKLPGCSSFLP